MKHQTLFPIRVLEETWDDVQALNKDLLGELLEMERLEVPMQKSNAGGWHSREDILQRDVPCFRDLHTRLCRMTEAMTNLYGARKDTTYTQTVQGWSIITRDREYNYQHNHPMCLWSGVYYVSVGRPSKRIPLNGYLEFIDPHMGSTMWFCRNLNLALRHAVKPVVGKVMVFPAWLPHFVHPFNGKGERVVIAFNCTVSADKGKVK